jgi:hypothetical protein
MRIYNVRIVEPKYRTVTAPSRLIPGEGRMAKKLWIVALTAACAHTTRTAPVAPPATDAIACGGECWNRAVVWIATHSYAKLRVTTGEVLETEGYASGPGRAMGQDISSRYSPYSFQVTRHDDTISMIARGSSHCPPIADDLRAAFYKYVTTGVDVLAGTALPVSWRLCAK